MILEPTISYGAILTALFVMIGWMGTIVYQAFSAGKFTATLKAQISAESNARKEQIERMDERLERLEANESKLTEALTTIAENKIELRTLNDKIESVQRYGSHRLAEILESIRGQISGEFAQRIDRLQAEIFRHDRGE